MPGFSPIVWLKPINVNYLDPLAEANGNVEKDEADRVNLSSIELDSNIDCLFFVQIESRGRTANRKHSRTAGGPKRAAAKLSTGSASITGSAKPPNRDHRRPIQIYQR
jgi:hypothetical protein